LAGFAWLKFRTRSRVCRAGPEEKPRRIVPRTAAETQPKWSPGLIIGLAQRKFPASWAATSRIIASPQIKLYPGAH